MDTGFIASNGFAVGSVPSAPGASLAQRGACPSVTRFHERACASLKTFETATRVPARLIPAGEMRQLPPLFHEACRKARSMSDSAIRCARWHSAMRESAGGSDGLLRAVCEQGLLTAAVPLRARDFPIGLVEFGPLPGGACSASEAALELSGPLLRELEREACAAFDLNLQTFPEPVRRAIAFLESHFTSRLDLAAVARGAALSPGHFSKVFRASTGRSVAEYLAWVRVNRACEQLVAKPHARISEIAMDCGFDSIPHFNRQFRKLTGRSPGGFRADQLHKERVRRG
ncbi:MAG: AraC family transcriptional regulator [Terrimicrobiaceae bacterium]